MPIGPEFEGNISPERRIWKEGNYTVVITAFENDPTAEEYAAGVKRKSLIPEKHSNPLTSGLEAVVTDGENEFTFDLHQKK